MRTENFKIILLSIILFIGSNSCQDNYDFGSISTDSTIQPSLLLPLVKGNIKMTDIIKEMPDTVIYENDKSIRIAFRRDNIFSVGVNDYLKTPEFENYKHTFTIGKLDIPASKFTEFITAKDLGINTNGTVTNFSGIPPHTTSFIDMDGTLSNFRKATFSSGKLKLTITNKSPVPITAGTGFELKNKTGQVFGRFVFASEIKANETVSAPAMDLAGKTIKNDLQLRIVNIGVGGGTNVNIDPKSNGIEVTFETENLIAESGQAILSKKTLSPGVEEVKLNSDNAKLYFVKFKKGKISINIKSEIQTKIEVKLTFLDLLENGNIKEEIVEVNYTEQKEEKTEIDLSDCELILNKGSQNNANILRVKYEIRNKNISEYITFTQDDKIDVTAEIKDIKFEMAKGYFGKQNITVDPDKIDLNIDMLDALDGGFTLTNPKIKLLVSNSVGIPGSVNMNIDAISYNGEKVNLTKKIEFTSPTISNKYITEEIVIDKNNSNVVDFISLPPSQIGYNISAMINEKGETTTPNFISDTSRFAIGMELDLPLELKTSNLIIIDTTEINLGEKLKDVKNTNAELNFWVNNGFPFKLDIELTPVNIKTGMKYTPMNVQVLEIPEIDSKGRVSKPKQSKNILKLSNQNIEELKVADNLIVKMKIQTGKGGKIPVKLYTDYEIDLNIGLKANAEVGIN